jgi:hypothetical protein
VTGPLSTPRCVFDPNLSGRGCQVCHGTWKSVGRGSCPASTCGKGAARLDSLNPGSRAIMLRQAYGTPPPFQDKGASLDRAVMNHGDAERLRYGCVSCTEWATP